MANPNFFSFSFFNFVVGLLYGTPAPGKKTPIQLAGQLHACAKLFYFYFLVVCMVL